MSALAADTDHGVYDALPVRESDGAPALASHAVYHEDGSLAGFACASVAWDAAGRELGYPETLPGAISLVCEHDRPARLREYARARPRRDVTACRCNGCRYCDPCCCIPLVA